MSDPSPPSPVSPVYLPAVPPEELSASVDALRERGLSDFALTVPGDDGVLVVAIVEQG